MNPVPREIEYDYDQMTQDFKSAKKEAPIKPIKVAEGVYKKPVGKTSRRHMFVRITSALPQLQRQNIRGPFPYPIHTLSYPYIHISIFYRFALATLCKSDWDIYVLFIFLNN